MDAYLNVAVEALALILLLSLPPLLASLIVGAGVSLLQALTQVQEQTLTFVPKVVVTILVLMFTAGWMLDKLQTFATHVFSMIGRAGV
jgi:flagellar biosynthetic protein FliQ